MDGDDFDYTRPGREWPIPPMDKGSGHKDSAFSWAMGNLILQRIADGDTMKEITADPRMPAYCTVFRWMNVVFEFGAAVCELRVRMAEAKLAQRAAEVAARGPKRRSGRRSTYSDTVAAQVVEAVREGASLSEVVRRPGAPSFRAIYRWLRDRPDFREAYIDACANRSGWLDFQAGMAVDRLAPLGAMAQCDAERRALFGRRGRVMPKLYRREPAGHETQPYHRDVRERGGY